MTKLDHLQLSLQNNKARHYQYFSAIYSSPNILA